MVEKNNISRKKKDFEDMYNIEVLGENGAWYKVNKCLINIILQYPHEFHSFYAVFEAHFFTENFFSCLRTFSRLLHFFIAFCDIFLSLHRIYES